MIGDPELLALHREVTSIASVSGEEAALADRLEAWMAARGWTPRRIGNSLLVLLGRGPLLLLDTHLDTVPPAAGWTRDPLAVTVENGRVYGLGANDAKASVAAMLGAVTAFESETLDITLGLALVEAEETRGTGTEAVLAELERQGRRPAAAVVGEPTGLEVAVAQKGLLILELRAHGDTCHAAHARTLGARNAIRGLARDLAVLDRLELGPEHPFLGPTTCEPTLIEGGTARNVLPGEASVVLDLRTTPAVGHDALIARIGEALRDSELVVVSRRLEPRETDPEAPVVRAALRARPGARVYGSTTMSDLVFLGDIPAVKCGPGQSERSHTPDEFVLEREIVEGRHFYVEHIRHYRELLAADPATA